MDERYERAVLRISAVCLAAAAVLIPVGSVGVAPSLPVVVALALLTAGTFAAVERLPLPAYYLDRLWVGPALATLLSLLGVAQTWTAGETQAVGGIVGMVGVANLFLRPVYRLGFYVAETLGVGRESDERSS